MCSSDLMWKLSNSDTEEIRRCNTDDCVDGIPNGYGLAHYIRPFSEALLPPGITCYRNWMPADRLIIGVGENSAENRRHSKNVKEAAGHQLGADLLQVLSAGDAAVGCEQNAADGSDFGKDCVLLPKFLNEWIGEKLPAAIWQIINATTPRPLAEEDELLWFLNRQVS